jgi:hypothetical protein
LREPITDFGIQNVCVGLQELPSQRTINKVNYIAEIYLFMILEATSLRSSCQQGLFLLKATLLSLETVVFFWCLHIVLPLYIFILIFYSYENTSCIGLEPTLKTLFNFNCLFKALSLQIKLHSKVLGIRTSKYEFGRNTI